jgi:hypothetical protein
MHACGGAGKKRLSFQAEVVAASRPFPPSKNARRREWGNGPPLAEPHTEAEGADSAVADLH